MLYHGRMASPWAIFLFSMPFLLIVLSIPVAYAALSTSDRLIRLEYASHREDWERDGRPWGPYWRPPESGTLEQQWRVRNAGRTLAGWGCFYAWLFETPDWIRQDREALKLIFRLRVLALAFALCAAGALCAFVGSVVVNVVADLS